MPRVLHCIQLKLKKTLYVKKIFALLCLVANRVSREIVINSLSTTYTRT